MSILNDIEKNEKSITQNGASAYNSTGHDLLDINFAIPAFRKNIEQKYLVKFASVFRKNKILAMKWLLYLRDIKEGLGERKSFREFCLKFIGLNEDIARKFFYYIDLEYFGRFDDYVYIAYHSPSRKVKKTIYRKLYEQLEQDVLDMRGNHPVSLLAKWLPSVNTSSKETVAMAKEFIYFANTKLFRNEKEYRKLLSKLRKYIDVVEVKMSNNHFDKIDYEKVPSYANLKYSNAFMNHDYKRRAEYLEKLKEGKAKINADTLFLYDIVHKYATKLSLYGWSWHKDIINSKQDYYDETLEQLWKAQETPVDFKETLVIRDGSGSMTVNVSGMTTALDVADSIALYFAERNKGEFAGKFITFSSKPQVVTIDTESSLMDKLMTLHDYGDCSNTDIEKTFMLILNTAVENHYKQSDLPERVLIVSDMEWDALDGDYYSTAYSFYNDDPVKKPNKVVFEELQKRFEDAGYKMPRLIFWNVNSGGNKVPLQENDLGVTLVSGFSKNIVSMVMSDELDPYKALLAELDKSRYQIVDAVFEENKAL